MPGFSTGNLGSENIQAVRNVQPGLALLLPPTV